MNINEHILQHPNKTQMSRNALPTSKFPCFDGTSGDGNHHIVVLKYIIQCTRIFEDVRKITIFLTTLRREVV
jgi:hypothetical protein